MEGIQRYLEYGENGGCFEYGEMEGMGSMRIWRVWIL